jgi:hypothetical protein
MNCAEHNSSIQMETQGKVPALVLKAIGIFQIDKVRNNDHMGKKMLLLSKHPELL